MIRIKTTIDLENRTPVRRRVTATERRQAWDGLRTAVQAIRTGQTTVRSESPRQIARYGRVLPAAEAARFTASYRRHLHLGQRRRVLVGNAERETWANRNRELATEHYAADVQRRRHITRR